MLLLGGFFLILYGPTFYFKLLRHLKVDTLRASCVVLISSIGEHGSIYISSLSAAERIKKTLIDVYDHGERQMGNICPG